MLLHWPNPQIPLSETLGALCKVKQSGLARHIGVSNFTVPLIEEAVRLASEPLVCNQIEMHPFLDQSKVTAACRAQGMAVVAYSPIARGGAKNDAVLARIGAAHGKSAAQVCLRWLVQQGIVGHSAHRPGRASVGELRDLRLRAVARPRWPRSMRWRIRDGRIVDYAYSGSPKWD